MPRPFSLSFGTFGDDLLTGRAGRDRMFGLFGDDTIEGGAGRDTIKAGWGDDLIDGGAGRDTIDGGRGQDTAVFAGSVGDYEIAAGRGGRVVVSNLLDAGDVDTLRRIETLYFAADDYFVDLTGGNNAVRAVDDMADVSAFGSNVLGDLAANDFDFDGDDLSVIAIDGDGLVGTVRFENGVVTYDAEGAFDALAEGETASTEFGYTVADGRGSTDTGRVTLTVTGVNDAPTLTAAATATVAENTQDVLTASASDVDAGDEVTLSLAGADADLFEIAADGALRFRAAPDFETPGDAGGDNIYDVTIVATDAGGLSDSQDVAVTVIDADETPALRINEFHYDNAGADVGEFIEVAGAAGFDLTGWSLALYNGSNGTVYRTIALDGTLSQDGIASVDAEGLQNGSPDGIALVAPDGSVAEFLSYEGPLTATSGPASGMTSTDVGVSEGGGTAIGESLQLQADGTWSGPAAATRDAPNDGGGGNGGGGESEAVLISTVQGSGASSTLVDRFVNVTAVVTATMANGFYLQEEDADADGDAATSEGIFVFTSGAPTVTAGEIVFAEGIVEEFFGQTQIAASTVTGLGTADLPSAAGLTLPFEMEADLETVEGMRVSVTSAEGEAPLTIIENFNFDRFGEIVVSAGVQINPTQIFDAQTEAGAVDELQARNAANRLTVDDGNSAQNPTSFAYIANDTAGDDGDGILSAGDDFAQGNPAPRLGAELDAPIEGVLSYAFGAYKVVPTETLAIDPATNDGAREIDAPDVGGDLQVVSFNALNYFTTLGERGAFTAEDLARQTEKLVNALVEIDGEIIGLQEIENNGYGEGSAIATLTAALNERLGDDVYAFVDPTSDGGPIGTDAIATGLIYKQEAVSVVGADYLEFDDGGQQRNRPAVAATFEDPAGERVTVAVNHFKSKGSSGLDDESDPNFDQDDGQGFWNAARADAAEQLTAWLATDPLGSGDADYLIIGDLNAYSQEDPVQAIEAAGYDNLIEEYIGAADAFSFVFDGQRGALDHALATESLSGQITGVAEWHINAPEPDLLSYNSRFTDPGFYNGGDPFAASDHDPLIVGLTLGTQNEEPAFLA